MIAADPRRRFLALFKELNIRFGYEESCKLCQGRLLADRCLVSFGRSDICGADGDLALVKNVLRELTAPPSCDAWLARHSTGAGVIHFGFEADGDARVHKIYLEYVRDAREALEAPGGPQAPVLVHRALKWRAGTGEMRETHYRLLPRDGLTLDERLVQQAGEGEQRLAVGMTRGILREALTRAKPDDLILLDVADIDSARHSFDLQLYDAGLRLANVEAKAIEFGKALDIPAASLTDFFEKRMALPLGHIAGGQDAEGSAFATLYYGAQAQ